MVEVYDDCTKIDHCADKQEKAALIVALRNKLTGSNRAWAEGIFDFLDFESFRLARGHAPVTPLGDTDDLKVMAVLDAAYRHGAFRGLCRTPGGAEWIGVLGEFCAAMVHQGFKWLRSADVDDWELPALGQAWCKGMAAWGLVGLTMAVDAAGQDTDNDEALYRIHTVVVAHHMAGAGWLRYRGPHPHRHFDRTVRGAAPAESAIRQFAAWRGWPRELTEVLVRSARHVNTWVSPPAPPIHHSRQRGLILGPHTPRLNARVNQVVDELVPLIGDMTPEEITEARWRCGSWLMNFLPVWRARGDRTDAVPEVSAFGGVLGVLRESRPRPHITTEQAQRIIEWCRARTEHLRPDDQRKIMDEIEATVAIRGRLPGAPSATGTDARRFKDGVWSTAALSVVYSRHGGREVPEDMREPTVRLFNAITAHRRIPGLDVERGHVNTDCWVCVCDQLFTGLVDNRPCTGVLVANIQGSLSYCHCGLGATVDDNDLGTR
ncbi:hypothetical protein FXF51_26225 [Nonomuraea sp. PA05]|uniref:hypothetical protein n=1 Tax=Nonomuraea sp. PA05 TaxID=2604466 RepID=UPI0011DA082E|nr:hypothetical protein [Nonomuraea sp. PA05]TYB62215.1 hypothetical protein FXF51_26225 [Nonomuraea sp. PA05]